MSLTASMKAGVVYEDGRYPYASDAAYEPGDVIVRPCGTLAIYDGLEGCATGDRIDPVPIAPTKIVAVRAPTAATWSAGAVVYWDVADDNVNTDSGNPRFGLAIADKTSGITEVLVNCVPA